MNNYSFIYCLQLPQILLKIQQQSLGGDFNIEVEQAFNMLLNSAPLLNLADLKMRYEMKYAFSTIRKLKMYSVPTSTVHFYGEKK